MNREEIGQLINLIKYNESMRYESGVTLKAEYDRLKEIIESQATTINSCGERGVEMQIERDRLVSLVRELRQDLTSNIKLEVAQYWLDKICKPLLEVGADSSYIRLLADGLRRDLRAYSPRVFDAIADYFDSQKGEKPPQPYPPVIVCLCGSTRFSKAFQDAQLRETLVGKIVLTIGCNMRSDFVLSYITEIFGQMKQEELDEIKRKLDELHLRKIDIADEVLILDVDGNIGKSTTSELNYARTQGKRIRFLSREQKGEKPEELHIKKQGGICLLEDEYVPTLQCPICNPKRTG